jgi:hypothetical protein
MSSVPVVRGRLWLLAATAVSCLCSASFASISFSNNTLTYGSPSDLGTTIDPSGLNEVAVSYGVSKASFQSLSPQIVAFNGAPTPSQTLGALVVYHTTSGTVTFTFPTAMYNYGSYTSVGRGAFSGTSLQDAISAVPSVSDSLNDWFDATITTNSPQGVQALGFCAAFRNDQAVPAGQVLFDLSDSTTGSVTLPALGGSGNPEYVFIGYQAPAGKTITRVRASRASSVGGAWVSIDDLSFVMSPDTTAPAAVSNLAAGSPTSSSLTLTWTAPGDDGSSGTAASYDIRYSTATINDTNWASATQVSGGPTPAAAGTGQNMVVSGLSAGTTYYFAMKTADEVPNWSSLSNVASEATAPLICTWTGSTSQNWSVAGNWNPATVPGAGMIGLVNIASPYAITDANLAGSPTIQVASGGLVAHKGNVTLTTPVTLAGGTWRLGDAWAGSTLNASLTVTAASVLDGVRGTSLGISGALGGTAPLTFRSTDQYLTDGADWTISSSNNPLTGDILIDSGNYPTVTAGASRALGTGDFTVRSTGRLVFGANQDYSGASRTPMLFLEGGTTGMTDHLAGASIPFNVVVQSQGGTLGTGTWASDNVYSGSVTLNGPLTLAGSRAYSLTNYSITGQISGSQAVTVNTTDSYGGGRGVVRLTNAANSFASLTLQMGYLKATSEGALSSGPISLYTPDSMTKLYLDKATDANWTTGNNLSGTGTIQIEGGSGFALNTSGSISPGIGAGNTGTITIAGNLGFASSASLAVDLNAADTQNPVADVVAVSGNVSNLANATLNIAVTGDAGTISGTQFTILTCANDLTGQAFGSVTVPQGWNKTVIYGNGSVKVTLSQGGITFANNTLTYGSPGDLGTVIDPAGLNEVATSYGVSKASFQALSPQVVAFNGAPAPTQTLRTLVATYAAGSTVTFTFPAVMYNYGSYTSFGRGGFSGVALQDSISTVPNASDGAYDWFDATISSTGGQAVTALGFCVAFRSDQSVPAGQVLFTLSDATTGTIALPALGGGNPQYVFIGYQAPAGKTITRVQASRTGTPGGGYVSIDDLSFVMSSTDTTAPAAVSNLAASGATASSVTLTWTAPGDDGSTGTAASYDIRYSTATIDEGNWASATQVSGEPAPAVAGTNQNMTVSGLSGDTTYYFAMKTADEVPNTSGLSNVVSRKTSDTVAPAAVSNLATSNPTNTSITLTWTAPGDNGSSGTASSYDIRYRTGGAVNDSNWAAATQVSGEPTPAAAGTNQSMVVSGLTAGTTYYFAIKTADEVPTVSAISNSPSGTTTSTGGNPKPILGQSDFVYQGYYIVQRSGYDNMAELNYGQGFTHRYVNGQLRFLTFSFFGNVSGGGFHVIEFAPPTGGLGGTITTRTNHWPDIMGTTGLGFGNGVWMGLWYEQAQDRLWTTWAIDYPGALAEPYTKSFVVRTLNADGTVSNVQGPWGLEGIQQRRVYGGVAAVPAWFQSTYGCGPYSAGWGGYASRMGIGPVSMGPTSYTFPEPTGYPAGDIPTSAFKSLMDHSAATLGADWYADGVPTTKDRGVRNTDVQNDYDYPYWQSPAPDGLGRWTWGDSNWDTGCWIETPNKQGFILIPKLCNGRTWYETSTLHCERQSAEIQVFDPNMLGQVAQGTRAAWNTYPTNRWEITSTCTPLGLMWGRSGNGPDGGPAGASYDSTTQTLYIYCIGGTSWNSYILVYHVN